MIAYAESSAVVAWLFDESRGSEMGLFLAGADRVFTSAVTEVECARAIVRSIAAGTRSAAHGERMSRALQSAHHDWSIIELHEDVVVRACEPFPVEPIRALDAIHVASALSVAGTTGVSVLSLDQRVRANAAALGLTVLPAKA